LKTGHLPSYFKQTATMDYEFEGDFSTVTGLPTRYGDISPNRLGWSARQNQHCAKIAERAYQVWVGFRDAATGCICLTCPDELPVRRVVSVDERSQTARPIQMDIASLIYGSLMTINTHTHSILAEIADRFGMRCE
jgi:hypothetical protein